MINEIKIYIPKVYLFRFYNTCEKTNPTSLLNFCNKIINRVFNTRFKVEKYLTKTYSTKNDCFHLPLIETNCQSDKFESLSQDINILIKKTEMNDSNNPLLHLKNKNQPKKRAYIYPLKAYNSYALGLIFEFLVKQTYPIANYNIFKNQE